MSETQALFPLGRTLITPGAQQALEIAEVDGRRLLARHVSGDWGDVGTEDRAANESALKNGARLMSVYTVKTNVKLWVITEADRSSTTILLPEEY